MNKQNFSNKMLKATQLPNQFGKKPAEKPNKVRKSKYNEKIAT
jgi:hypothetical protein